MAHAVRGSCGRARGVGLARHWIVRCGVRGSRAASFQVSAGTSAARTMSLTCVAICAPATP
ncbi:hypothetical protein B0G74_2410 [Paraburkholderia sp. BL9I2N2]|nr:hypothetical protein B0G74_2410 [Paraburkholderia sp. BL9I2N2]